MSGLEFRMNFEEERLAGEKAAAFDNRVAEILSQIDGDPTPHQLIAAITQAHEDLDPNRGELVYELEEPA